MATTCWPWPPCWRATSTTPSLRGKVDLIYIDPLFDSKADYRTKVTLRAWAGQSPR